MRNLKLLFILISLFAGVHATAKVVTDTIVSSDKDRVIITYEVIQSDGRVTINFQRPRKILGSLNSKKYAKLDEIKVFFFDRVGRYADNTDFSGISVRTFNIPSNVKYNGSRMGYYLLEDGPALSLEMTNSEPTNLSIPLFLAHYEGPRKYKVFSRCDGLIVKINSVKEGKKTMTKKTKRTVASQEENELSVEYEDVIQTFTSDEEDGSFTPLVEADILIKKVRDLLNEQDEYPFSDELKQAIASLRDCSYRITDANVSAQINEVLSACKSKEDNLKGEVNAAAAAAESKAKLEAEQAKAEQDSIRAAEQQEAEAEKKRNFWMLLGGAILAFLCFIGNQFLQHYRNVKNQKSLTTMQENVVKRAENEAKRRARSMAQGQVSKIKNEARKDTRNLINSNIVKINKFKTKNNKGVSI